jgi:hypothetical protein
MAAMTTRIVAVSRTLRLRAVIASNIAPAAMANLNASRSRSQLVVTEEKKMGMSEASPTFENHPEQQSCSEINIRKANRCACGARRQRTAFQLRRRPHCGKKSEENGQQKGRPDYVATRERTARQEPNGVSTVREEQTAQHPHYTNKQTRRALALESGDLSA